MCATLSASVFELTRPTYSSMRLGLLPAASMVVGLSISVGMRRACDDARRGSTCSLRGRRAALAAETLGARVAAVFLRLAQAAVFDALLRPAAKTVFARLAVAALRAVGAHVAL